MMVFWSSTLMLALIATQPADYVQPGSQPSPMTFDNFRAASPLCASCHADYREGDVEPYDGWVASMMAQSARDPMTRAAAAIANNDAENSAETCIRCHSPIGWLGGRSSGGEFADLTGNDLDGVTCHVCHRMVDPIARANAPVPDASILSALDVAATRPMGSCTGNPTQACASDAACGASGPCVVDAGQARYVIDPEDRRRGPRAFTFHLHPTVQSPFHSRSDLCATCHDVSTPTVSRQSDGSYALNALGAAHPTQDPDAMFPEQRTYSEWRASTFAGEGVVFADGRFGGAKTATLPNVVAVSTCQDCHMPTAATAACSEGVTRPDTRTHGFAGANSWVLGAILDEYGATSGLNADRVESAHARTREMLQRAADLAVSQRGHTLTARVTNQSGHKLPTGYPEGRRMWVEVAFFAGTAPTPIATFGDYDETSATLDVDHTVQLFEAKHVIGEEVAGLTGLSAGTSFHLALNTVVAADSRIPPRGFTWAAFDAFGGAPVGAMYADGQHWSDGAHRIPDTATRAEVHLWYQTTSREYAEFLRDTAPDGSGQNAYDRWLARGRSAPVEMGSATIDLKPRCLPAGAACDDANPCTEDDACSEGACVGVEQSCADDSNVCTEDVCVPATGTCGAPRADSCDDGDACSVRDACEAGVCRGRTEGLDGARCVANRLRASDVCAAPLPRAVRRVVDAHARKLLAQIDQLERKLAQGAPPKAVRRLAQAVRRTLDRLEQRLDAATRARKASQRLDTVCASVLQGLSDRVPDPGTVDDIDG